ncbi:hypothetical protein SK854_28320 [Lentzea sp. BCCO 10_0061]|uniref:Uncharacterized protein n=1 Tax=Lentzea sokolovensis TaxID=3095429 RepID=A0ABU4V2M6_9PSEU|nr:hypothetical protein [Lentzea sp. BCCO 10_0061]MDX8146046.1 hypothetical protein [Lentzea sp. BCCO 10_0061]
MSPGEGEQTRSDVPVGSPAEAAHFGSRCERLFCHQMPVPRRPTSISTTAPMVGHGQG